MIAVAVLIAFAAIIIVLAFKRAQQPAPALTMAVTPLALPTESPDKVQFHIARFTAALEQNAAGPEKEAELIRHLNYWKAIKAAIEETL